MSILSLRSPAYLAMPRRAARTLPLPIAHVASRRVPSEVLLDGHRELVIQHQGSEYHLRLTRNDKLILTK
ncbi:MAG: hemin uptake protein HemP [Rhodanobacter sp.]|nr:MAG: hemin uptake protein HemP [Rhodanobacter sp.]TAL92362.1 MAG: hemin uptake protein HemP [Rhodanobacter sp.]TAM41470.1 MAG: hemin uptake protein HemP [Rhodanobacter sp.]TAN29389.1 MAG: hemin uptake protein HemP [Rhodanobacter sp.]